MARRAGKGLQHPSQQLPCPFSRVLFSPLAPVRLIPRVCLCHCASLNQDDDDDDGDCRV